MRARNVAAVHVLLPLDLVLALEALRPAVQRGLVARVERGGRGALRDLRLLLLFLLVVARVVVIPARA